VAEELHLEPLECGWRLRAAGIDNDLLFLNGARAEEAALRLAIAFANSGSLAELKTSVDGSEWTNVRRFQPGAAARSVHVANIGAVGCAHTPLSPDVDLTAAVGAVLTRE